MKIKRCLVVLGMHRSGTSVITGMLKILGVPLGSNLLEPSKHNKKGYFEDKDILDVNEKILKNLNSSWDDVSEMPKGWWRKRNIYSYKEKIKFLIKEKFSDYEIFGLKDPRISILLPLYIDLFKEMGIVPYFIIVERKDLEIAKSLEKREKFLFRKSLLLCDKYRESISRFTKGKKKIKLIFKDILSKPRKTIRDIEKNFGIRFNNYESVMDKIHEFLDSSLKHHSFDNGGDLFFLVDMLDEKNLQLKKASKQIRHRDKKLKKASKQIRYKDDMLKEKNLQLKKASKQIRYKDDMLKEKDSIIKSLEHNLSSILESFTWRVLMAYQKIVDMIIPYGTNLRKSYDWIIIKNRNLFKHKVKN